jgi:hypothetical protein
MGADDLSRHAGARRGSSTTGQMSVSEEELLAVAHEAAGAAARELMSRFGGRVQGLRTKSTATDPVS